MSASSPAGARRAPLLWSALVSCFLLLLWQLPALAAAPVPLRDARLEPLATPGAPEAPAFQEEWFPLQDAVNLKEVERRLGKLSPAQRAFLEKNRFLLLPKKQFGLYTPWVMADEMLDAFDSIGQLIQGKPHTDRDGQEYIRRDAASAVFVGPDIFLHALHTYFSQRLRFLESRTMAPDLARFLRAVTAETVRLGSAAADPAPWERLRAQLTVPLILLESTPLLSEEDRQNGVRPPADTPDNALNVLRRHAAGFSPAVLAAMEQEIRAVYAARNNGATGLGLSPAYQSKSIDYGQFTPRGYYGDDPELRGWFRAMIWLGQLGWNLAAPQGLADALNFALALSAAPEADALTPWKRIMELSGFFVGSPDTPGYPEWAAFLKEKAGVDAFTADSAADPQLLARLTARLPELAAPPAAFSDLRRPSPRPIFSVFPQRFTVPWLIADVLSRKDSPEQRDLPPLFSALWVPAVLGSAQARDLVPEQAARCLTPRATASAAGAPLPTPPAATSAGAPAPEPVQHAVQTLQQRMDALSARLEAEPAASWYSSQGTAWLRLLRTLGGSYGEGYPLYMRGPLFPRKQLESFLGSFTELKHDTILYEKPNYAEYGGGAQWTGPVPRSFVEPNLPFWNDLLTLVGFLRQGFAHHNIFPNDIDATGVLTRFRNQAALCAALAAKELRGEQLSGDDHEALRTLQLKDMALPPDGAVLDEDRKKSALVVDIQTVTGLDGAPPLALCEGLADPWVMLVLVGNEDTPRIVTGLAFNHREFIIPAGTRPTDARWRKRVYAHLPLVDDAGRPRSKAGPRQPLPPRNFWYDGLLPK